MTHENYKKSMLGKRVDFDSAYGYQCVDLMKDYCYKVFGIRYYRTGNANEIWTNRYKIFDKRWKKITGTSDLKVGDIILSINGKYGHVSIVDLPDGTVLEQNGSGKNSGSGVGANAIRLYKRRLSFRKGVRRFIG